MNIVIVHPGALGDVLLSLRALRGLRRSFPDKRCVWVGKTEIGELLYSMGEIDHLISLDAVFFSDLFLSFKDQSALTKEIFNNTSHFIGWFSDQHLDLSQNLELEGLPHVIIRSPHDATLSSLHYEDRYVETVSQWGVALDDHPSERIDILHNLTNSPDGLSSGCHEYSNPQKIAIHPGSGSPHKCTMISSLASMAMQLHHGREHQREFIIMKGPADEKNVHDLCAFLRAMPYRVICDQSLSSVSKILASIDLFIGHDSGLTHLAATRGVPSIILFGPTDPLKWAPRGNHVTIFQGNTCRCPDWASVQDCQSKRCLNISVDKVIEQAEYWLNTQSKTERRSHYTLQ